MALQTIDWIFYNSKFVPQLRHQDLALFLEYTVSRVRTGCPAEKTGLSSVFCICRISVLLIDRDLFACLVNCCGVKCDVEKPDVDGVVADDSPSVCRF